MSRECPNILMIVVDSGRFDQLVADRSRRAAIPFLQRFIEQATRYTNANAPGGATRISMNSIFVGVYPETYGFSKNKLPSPDQLTIAQRLQSAGYQTLLYSSDPCVSPETRMDRGFDHVFYLPPWSRIPLKRPRLVLDHWPAIVGAMLHRGRSYKVPVEMMAGEAIRHLKVRQPTNRPFFLYIHLDVHRPFVSERRYLRQFLEPGITNAEVCEVERLLREPCFYRTPKEMVSPRKERLHSIVRSMYAAAWLKTDQQIRGMVEALRQQNLFDSTLIAITSDHGESLGERDQVRHGAFPYQEAMHVPLIVKYPKGVGKAPGPDERLSSTIDLMPTICELGGCPVHQSETNGISLLDNTRRHKYVINQRWSYRKANVQELAAQYPHYDWAAYDLGHVIALRDDRYKYVWTSKGASYLFDLQYDPGEKHNLAEAGEWDCDGILAHYAQMLQDWRADLNVREGWDESRLRPKRRGPYSAPVGG